MPAHDKEHGKTHAGLAATQPRPMDLAHCPPPLDEPQEIKPLDDGWRQWIAENALRRCSPESMLATLSAAGIDPAQATGVLSGLAANPIFRAAEKMRDRYERLARVTLNLQKLAETAPAYEHVEKRSRVSREEFLERYVRGCRPLVLTDLAREWPAMKSWSFEEMARRYGHMTVQVQGGRNTDPDFEINKGRHRHDTNFGDFLRRVGASGPSNDEYLTANNELLRRPDFAGLLADIGPMTELMDQAALRSSASLWIGPAGTRTPLHHDTLMLMHTQVVGRKRWRFVSPLSGPRLYNDFEVYSPVDFEEFDAQRFPDAAQLKVLDVVVEPGETMFLPLAWWHQVTSLDRCISVSLTNVAVPNDFDFAVSTRQQPDSKMG